MNELGDDITVGVYHSLDDIDNLKIRVFIQKTDPSSLSGQESTHKSSSSNLELLSLHDQNKSYRSESTFSWQDKVTGLETKEVSASSKVAAKNGSSASKETSHIRLFSYVDSEIRSKSQVTNSSIHCRCLKGENSVNKRTFSSLSGKTYQRPFILDAKDVVQYSSSKHAFHVTGLSMAIMACFEEDGDSEEVQLCIFHYDNSGVLTVFPDFGCSPFYVRTLKSGTFKCILENVSVPTKNLDVEKEKKFQKQVIQHHAEAVETAVGSVFDMPSSKTILWYLTVEFVSAKGFCAKNVFVHYTFQLQKGMEALHKEDMCGTTNTCKTKKMQGVTVAHFGFPLTFAAAIKSENLSSIGAEIPIIQLLLEVLSIDTWGITRHEGYGFCDIPICPGNFEHNVNTWRLLPQSIFGVLKNYFIGETLSIDDKSYMRIPKDIEHKRLNKYGARTEASGSVVIKVHSLLQFSCDTSPDDFVHQQKVTRNY